VRCIAFALALVFAGAAAGHSATVFVSGCGATVPDGQTGRLLVDLDCTGPGACADDATVACTTDGECTGSTCVFAPAVTLGRSATLEFAGHTMTLASQRDGVVCPSTTSRCRVRQAQITGGNVALRSARDLVVLDSATIVGAAVGIQAGNFATTGKVTGASVSIHDGGVAIRAISVRLSLADVRNNALGLDVLESNGTQPVGSVSIIGPAFVVGNAGTGIRAVRCVLRNTSVTGNGGAGDVDIATFQRPSLHGSVCDRSLKLPGPSSWGICTFDPPPS
jgi:hypothetical protein